ncbi:hypothetical protein [Cohaesibacter sp. ES.047]|uniref:hypothetical protein n=1 Tax=Cohaesibacter sp. ES.047 TaxID=1798205 RepID=UPI0012FD2440|nr:hypothetical protein [Cohaesibacter sp. ES.047]
MLIGLMTVSSQAPAYEMPSLKDIGAVKTYIEQHKSDPMPDGYTLRLGFCGDDNSECAYEQARLLADLKQAYDGDFQAQRNLAYCLESGCDAALFLNKTLSCAWRIVILASGHVEITDVDVANLEICTAGLDGASLSVTKGQAARLFEVIYGREIAPDWR